MKVHSKTFNINSEPFDSEIYFFITSPDLFRPWVTALPYKNITSNKVDYFLPTQRSAASAVNLLIVNTRDK